MKKNLVKNLIAISSIALLALPLLAMAQALPPVVPASTKSVAEVLNTLALAILAILGAAAVLFIVVAGFQFLTAGGDPEKVTAARDKVVYALVGIAVGALAWALIRVIIGIL